MDVDQSKHRLQNGASGAIIKGIGVQDSHGLQNRASGGHNFSGNSKLSLYNPSGKKCKQSRNGKPDMKHVKTGIYIAVLKDHEVKKLIIQP